MDSQKAFGAALKMIRDKRGLTQESFGDVSSRTYISTLERGMKSPTLSKVESISEQLEIHPLTLLAAGYAKQDGVNVLKLLESIKAELQKLEIT
jgi:transcriptional regulator with XRE-family HTH domain